MSKENFKKFHDGINLALTALEDENFQDKRSVALVKTKLDEARLWFYEANPNMK